LIGKKRKEACDNVHSGGLENRWGLKTLGGSNPSASARRNVEIGELMKWFNMKVCKTFISGVRIPYSPPRRLSLTNYEWLDCLVAKASVRHTDKSQVRVLF
jgi:hypothetical protein